MGMLFISRSSIGFSVCEIFIEGVSNRNGTIIASPLDLTKDG